MDDNRLLHTNRLAALQLFLVSLVMLFAEIALIRWLSTEARIFAYVNNLVLLSCFLGIGLGCYYSQRRAVLSLFPLSLTALILMIRLPLEITIQGRELHVFRDVPMLLSAFTDSLVWYEPGTGTTTIMTALGMISTLVIFLTVLVAFVPLGQLLGRLLDDHKNTVVAYSLNVAASIVGIWLFGGFSLMYSPPSSWFAFVALVLAPMTLIRADRNRFDLIAVLALSVAAITMSPAQEEDRLATMWSPYQKLELRALVDEDFGIPLGFHVDVNNVGYMSMLDLSDRFVATYPQLFGLNDRRLSQYDIPYLFKPDVDHALILGAGAGNDAAGALRNGVDTVHAVEIDPGIFHLGSRYHPERPYDDPRVAVIVDDARSFLKRTTTTYDMISFGLLDAHTLSSAYNNTRIDHYVYTLESIQDARQRLSDDGVLTMSFEAQRPWIISRLRGLLTEVFAHEPVVFVYRRGESRLGWGGAMFVTARDMDIVDAAIDGNPGLQNFIQTHAIDLPDSDDSDDPVRLTTDDWPYLYLESARIPSMHLCVTLVLGLLIVLAGRATLTRGRGLNLHFFFLGAAFLLLEFQNISKSSLLFGSTWMVSSIVITAILILVLLANLFVSIVISSD